MEAARTPDVGSKRDEEAWADPRLVVEGLDRASCSPHAKTMAIRAIGISAEGGTALDWRNDVAARYAEHPGWRDHLNEAERCMRAAGLWPWIQEEARSG